jgi:hypothetical protein
MYRKMKTENVLRPCTHCPFFPTHLLQMPAPSQRTDDVWSRRMKEEKEKQRELARECEALRQASLSKAKKEAAEQRAQQAKSRALWESMQSAHASSEQNERQQTLSARRRALDEMEAGRDLREMEIEKQREHVLQAAHQAAGEFAKQQKQFHQEKQQQLERKRRQREKYERQILEKKHAAALHEAENAKERAAEGARIRAMREEIRQKQLIDREDEDMANEFMRTEMVRNARRRVERQRERTRLCRIQADQKKEELLDHLRKDHRVPRWYATTRHKTDSVEWRWPFSLDWSWLERGERILKDERFVGLTLPQDFVRPSDRPRTTPRTPFTPRTPRSTPRPPSSAGTQREQVRV